MFRHPAWVVGFYSCRPPAARSAETKSTGGCYHTEWSPCNVLHYPNFRSQPSLFDQGFTKLQLHYINHFPMHNLLVSTSDYPPLVFQARITNSHLRHQTDNMEGEEANTFATDFVLSAQSWYPHHDCRDSDGGERVGPPHGRAHRQGRAGPRCQRRRLGHAGTGFCHTDSYFRKHFDIFHLLDFIWQQH